MDTPPFQASWRLLVVCLVDVLHPTTRINLFLAHWPNQMVARALAGEGGELAVPTTRLAHMEMRLDVSNKGIRGRGAKGGKLAVGAKVRRRCVEGRTLVCCKDECGCHEQRKG
jgi:hypothetical protein